MLAAEAMSSDQSLSASVREDAAMIVRNISIEIQLISDLLDMSKVCILLI
jgi:hypothetical protein